MYVILTSKPGQFRTEPVPGVEPVERYEYLFYGRPTAIFVIAVLHAPVKVRVIDEAGGPEEAAPVVNHVPSKFLEHFDTLDAARDALQALAHFGSMDLSLRKL
ncbi:ferredoxin [Cupriavidus campinensis]